MNIDENFSLLISIYDDMSTIGKKTNINFKELKYSLIIKISLFPLSTIKNKITDKNIKNDGIRVIISNLIMNF